MPGSALVACAGLMGAAGVVLAALAAHAAPAAGLDAAAFMLVAHAAAIAAVAAARDRGLVLLSLSALATFGLIAGPLLFAADIAARAFAQMRLFPLAAPLGGGLMIIGWLLLMFAGLLKRTDR